MTSSYTPMVPYVQIRTEGWTCVRCGRGHYRSDDRLGLGLAACSACGLVVWRSARFPRVLVRKALRPASRRKGAA
jgi:ribosomal protein L37AE/L43A